MVTLARSLWGLCSPSQLYPGSLHFYLQSNLQRIAARLIRVRRELALLDSSRITGVYKRRNTLLARKTISTNDVVETELNLLKLNQQNERKCKMVSKITSI